MAYDSKRDRLLLYGGYGVQQYDDFWQWDPASKAWTQLSITQTPRPPGEYGHLMFYDAAGDKVLVVGGSGYIPIWQWDPVTSVWTDRSTPTATMPQELVQVSPGAIQRRFSPVLRASGGAVVGSTVTAQPGPVAVGKIGVVKTCAWL